MRRATPLVTQREFRKAHGDHIAADLDLDKLGFPILNHRDGVFWILDGQHRIYALEKFGFGPDDLVPCEVYENLSDPEAAEIFLGRSVTKAIGVYDKFHVACTAGRRRENDIRRAVETSGLKIGRSKEENTIGAIGACGKVYDRSGEVVLGQVVRAIKHAFAGDPISFAPEIIEGIGHVFNRYNGRTNERDLALRLGDFPSGVRGILRRAEAQREKTGNQRGQCIAATVVDIYNKGLPHRSEKRLPPWWKEQAGSEQ